MKRLVVATHNRDKFAELQRELEGLNLEVRAAFDFPGVPGVVEDGATLEENSLKKAREISDFTGWPALADDTGLFVEALGGQPGIYAARFAGEKCTYADNVRKMLDLMRGVAAGKRQALFRTVITLYLPGEPTEVFEGRVEGVISGEARPGRAFGYDPIFLPEGSSRAFSEMDMDEKNAISHRGRAVQKAKAFLARWASRPA
ncbi:MAG TPA: RdgB/HAM1 family non-canonical purine NTP pyrophosphatase [bacterium]|nr:RdgB/HAM1 family non-canonical purine NTP pyrophosphatase [bacterium]